MPVTAVSLEEAVEDLEDRALVRGGEVLDLPQALHEPCGAGARLVLRRLEPEELVGRDSKRPGEVEEHRPTVVELALRRALGDAEPSETGQAADEVAGPEPVEG